MAGKGKPLTIAMLGLAPKGKGMPDGEETEEETEEGGSEDEEGLPPGFLEASTEMRDAEDDESFAKAFHNALKCAGAC